METKIQIEYHIQYAIKQSCELNRNNSKSIRLE